MNLKKTLAVQVLSRRALLQPADFYKRLMLHHEMLPALEPTHWGWWEPARTPWDVSNLDAFIPDDRGGDADRVIWVRRKKPKAEGNLGVGAWSPQEKKLIGHASEWLHCELETCPVDALVAYIQRSSVELDCDIAFIHHVAEPEKLIREQETRFEGCCITTEYLSMNIHTLKHWLPTLPWGVVFGEAYVRLFGLDKLLTAPAYKVEKLSDTAVYLQLSEKLTDLETDYESVHAVRLQVQAHLGERAFFDEQYAYPLRGPMGTMTAEEYRAAWAAFKRQEPGTNGFLVPEFRLLGV